MKKLSIFTAGLFILGMASFVAYKLSPNYVDEQGLLHESFGFILLGYLFLFIGIIVGIIGFIRYKSRK